MSEPSCVLNHDAMRRELRDKRMSARLCPECKWLIHPAKEDPPLISPDLESEIKELIRRELLSFGLIEGSAEDE